MAQVPGALLAPADDALGRSIVADIISANTRRGLTKCNVKRDLSDRIVGGVVGGRQPMQGPLDRHTFDVACPGCKIKNAKTLGWLKAHNQFICEGCGKNIDIDKSRFAAGVDQIDKAFMDLAKTIRDLKR